MSPAASRLFVALALFGCLQFATSQAFAQDSDQQIVKSLSGQELQNILRAEGYFNVEVDADGDLNFKIEGTKVQIFVANDQESIQFHSAWAGTNATLRKVNEWNKTKKYSKAYLDDDGDPHLELDLDLAGGVTVARIKDFVLTCKLSLNLFQQEVL
ncbi:hypothetical protein Mal4_53920 [Maioricimonas rarisocia]|uniref:YbjN domain-containing protein n=1 Tax=Maioricimonas rarisocia TaxID=2528026 RepID=A0A517ZEX2_9PLAN|nr:YbjN domain-containing protein [Maioricimonas rarisocia]QDU41027.1 hypothetical protein Mal4_53920 [Maioricimonas rarisocia]